MVAKKTIPIVLLTGFLGTGKTSNLRRWLQAPEFARAMVIVNELGEVGLDHQIVAAADAPLLLDNGCACCEASDDLIATLEQLFFDRLHRKIPPFSWVLIETTGVADPIPIIELLQRSDIVAERYELAGVVATFDARLGIEQLGRHPEVRRQIECASVIVLTKADLATPDEVSRACDNLKMLSSAQILSSSNGDLAAGEVLAGLRLASPHRGSAGRSGDGDHHHVHAVHSEGITTAFLPIPEKVPWLALQQAVWRLFAEHGGAILRLKGVVELEEASAPQVIQASQDGIERRPLEANAADPRLGLTIIAQATPSAEIARSLFSHLGSELPAPVELPERSSAVSV